MDYEPKSAFEGLVLAKLEDLKSNIFAMDTRLWNRIDAAKDEIAKVNGRLRASESDVAVLKSEVIGVKAEVISVKTKSISVGGLSGGTIAAAFEILKGFFWK